VTSYFQNTPLTNHSASRWTGRIGVIRKSNVFQKALSGTQMGQKLTMDQVPEFIHVALGQYTTIFQAEIYAIGACVQENLRKCYLGRHIHILMARLP
jgi:hypothetical protein